ncbi:hypothetical protein [Carboxydothermus pertinax]|uniref:Uncharacterized protein n=1 Tax=Carboxydothermus pertinax TaxID=870242 RepID=A0A1L8CTX5_9THEO|nr:hypothetical protein [Carboxydothermus pertinax]GAV22299.1 hypothetical protein cpu_08090 [Carboxydothermus pertinax]
MLILLCRSPMVLKDLASFLFNNTQEVNKNVLYKFAELLGVEVLAISTFEDSLLKTIINNFMDLIGKKTQVLTLDLNPNLKTIEFIFWRFNFGGFREKKLKALSNIILTELNQLKDNLKENTP